MAAAVSPLQRSRLLAQIALALLVVAAAMGLLFAVWPMVRPFAWFLMPVPVLMATGVQFSAMFQASKTRPDYAETDLAELTRATASQFETIAQERLLSFTVLTPPELRVQVDPEQVSHVLLNLLSNACKFTPEGGRVRVTLWGTADRVHLEVADSGPGTATEPRFRRTESGTPRGHGGAGFGLAIAKDLVRLHAGLLTVTDAPEGGTQFVVDLPRTAPAGQTVRPSSAEDDGLVRDLAVAAWTDAGEAGATGAAGGGLVLVVEDSPDMNRFVCQTLERHHRVAAAWDASEGLRRALALEPDLVVTDAMLPGIGGEQLITAIRRERALNTTPVLMLTARADGAFRAQMLRSGVQDFMVKPFHIDELRARVANLISAKRALDDRARLAALVESAADSISIMTLDGKVLTWNPSAERIYGYTAQEMIGQSVFRLVPPESRPETVDLLARVGRGERAETRHTSRLRKDGSTVPIASTLSPVFGPTGAVVAASTICRDISEVIAAEEALRASEAKFAGIVSIASDGIVSVDERYRIVLYNHGAERMFGWTSDEVMGKAHEMLIPERFRAAHPAHVQAFAGETAESRPVGGLTEITALRKNGEEFPAEAAISKLVVGRQRLFTKVFRDVTDRKRAEAERERLITELQRALADVRTLAGLLPICAWCKKVRDDEGYWSQIEAYVTEHSEAKFSHSICPECIAKLEGDVAGE